MDTSSPRTSSLQPHLQDATRPSYPARLIRSSPCPLARLLASRHSCHCTHVMVPALDMQHPCRPPRAMHISRPLYPRHVPSAHGPCTPSATSPSLLSPHHQPQGSCTINRAIAHASWPRPIASATPCYSLLGACFCWPVFTWVRFHLLAIKAMLNMKRRVGFG